VCGRRTDGNRDRNRRTEHKPEGGHKNGKSSKGPYAAIGPSKHWKGRKTRMVYARKEEMWRPKAGNAETPKSGGIGETGYCPKMRTPVRMAIRVKWDYNAPPQCMLGCRQWSGVTAGAEDVLEQRWPGCSAAPGERCTREDGQGERVEARSAEDVLECG